MYREEKANCKELYDHLDFAVNFIDDLTLRVAELECPFKVGHTYIDHRDERRVTVRSMRASYDRVKRRVEWEITIVFWENPQRELSVTREGFETTLRGFVPE